MIDNKDKNLPVIDAEDKNASEHVKMSRRPLIDMESEARSISRQ